MTDNSSDTILRYYYRRLDMLAQTDKNLSAGKIEYELLKIHKLFQGLLYNLSEKEVKQDYIEQVMKIGNKK